ncbi:MAG: hypothetical protein O3B84_03320 [Chloroflexi bacterium]|nr:hypothetical protein [Chloroflexota bacterium]
MQRTRKLILDFINRHGPSTVDGLAGFAGVVPVTIRAHLAVLEREGFVVGRVVRTGKAGRPRIYYALMPKAREVFPKGYDHLAMRLLGAMESNQARSAFLHETGLAWSAIVGKGLEGAKRESLIAAAVEALDETGCEAEWREDEGRLQIRLHNCPYSNVVAKFPELCDMERTFLEDLLGFPVNVIESGPGCPECVMMAAPVAIALGPTSVTSNLP